MQNTPLARIGNYSIFETANPNIFEAVSDYGPVTRIAAVREGHFGYRWIITRTLRPNPDKFLNLFDLIQTLP